MLGVIVYLSRKLFCFLAILKKRNGAFYALPNSQIYREIYLAIEESVQEPFILLIQNAYSIYQLLACLQFVILDLQITAGSCFHLFLRLPFHIIMVDLPYIY